MANVEENRHYWNEVYDWLPRGGEEWSRRWGGSEMQWYGTVLPRIRRFLPASTLLEIAPGFGRMTHYLKDHCSRLMLVDLSDKCIQACKVRFQECAHIHYAVNDGRTLPTVDDQSVDFCFSFESLVHAEDDVMGSYLKELARVLKPTGGAFLHHSNLGEYAAYFGLAARLPVHLRKWLNGIGVMDLGQWRAPSMSAARFRELAAQAGLRCRGQETVNWGARRQIDCFSTVVPRESPWADGERLVNNPHFMMEVFRLGKLAEAYPSAVQQTVLEALSGD